MAKIKSDCGILRKNLRRFRKEKNMRQKDVVAKLELQGIHLGRTTYTKLEAGTFNFSESLIFALAKIFNVDPHDFLRDFDTQK